MRYLVGLLLVGLAACGTDPSKYTGDDDSLEPLDERVPLPEPDPAYIDIVTPERVLAPGEDKMYCLHVDNEAGEVAIDTLVGLQGKGGHHIALYTTTDPKPSGTIEECSTVESNAPLQWYVITSALGPGEAIRMTAGFHYVIQFHYINAGDQAILVRDVARIHKVDPASVTMWIASVVQQSFTLDIPAGETWSQTWDCTLPSDRDMVFISGHMHENGAKYTIDIGPSVNELQNIYTVDPWTPDLRDNPPPMAFHDAPMHLAAGTVIRTTCTWHNTTGVELRYPHEMCLTFSYMGGSDALYQCLPN